MGGNTLRVGVPAYRLLGNRPMAWGGKGEIMDGRDERDGPGNKPGKLNIVLGVCKYL